MGDTETRFLIGDQISIAFRPVSRTENSFSNVCFGLIGHWIRITNGWFSS